MERPIAFYPFLARELGSIEAAIYYQQIDYWQDKGGRTDGWIYKTREEIEEETTIGPKTQERIRKMLVTKGWLATKLMKANGSPTIHYKTLVSVKMTIAGRENGSGQNDHIELVRVTNSLTETTPKTTTDIDCSFEKFWKAYPRKVSKMASSRAFASVIKRNRNKDWPALFKRMMDAISVHAQTKQWIEGYIPHASTWLNGEKWNDEINLETEKAQVAAKKKPFIDGDPAYKKGDVWYVITHSGQHCVYGGNLDKLEWR